MKEQNSSKRAKWQGDSQSDGEFKTLVMKMLTELIELGWEMKEQMKDTHNEVKQNIQGTNSDRKEARTQINDLEQKKKINIQLEKKEYLKKKYFQSSKILENWKRLLWIHFIKPAYYQPKIC